MAQDFSGGLGGGGMKKMQSHMDGLRKPVEKPAQVNSGGGEEKTHTVVELGDGSATTKTHDGAEEHHEDHLAALTHLGHHMTGGEKHHMTHHDGMGMHSHGVHEDGSHEGTHDHENVEDAKESLGQFMGGGEGEQQGGGGKQQEEPQAAPLGGM